MRLSSFLLPAAAGLASASQPAEFYLLPQGFSTEGPFLAGWTSDVTGDVAGAVLQQRLGLDLKLPQSTDRLNRVVEYINHFGKASPAIFQDGKKEPHQLVVVYKGLTQADFQTSWGFITPEREFTVEGMTTAQLPPIYREPNCPFEFMTNPESDVCWTGTSQYLEYDVAKHPESLSILEKNFKHLESLATDRKMETLIVLLPASASDSIQSNDELRRRDLGFKSEHVLTEETAATTPPSDSASSDDTSDFTPHPFVKKKEPIPSSFKSYNACVSATSNCTSHGQCVNTFSAGSTTESWACRCLSTWEKDNRNGNDMLYHWGGNQCQKIDVSTPFWLFVGFTVVLVGLVGGSIGLLFSVGEEKLPGVIGAGVSRSK